MTLLFSFIGKQKPAKWLYRDFILGYFGKKLSSVQKGYQKFVNALVFEEYDSPLEQVVSSTLLGSADFIASIYQQEVEGNRFAVRHWAIRRITTCRRVAQKIEKDKRLKQKINRLEKQIYMSRMKT